MNIESPWPARLARREAEEAGADAHPRRASTHFVQMRSGACVDLLLPDLAPVTLTDIATNLSRIPRFMGGTVGDLSYSVAQHSVHVAECLGAWGHSPQIQLAGLFHDAPEALIGDCPTPVKKLMGPDWRGLEWRVAVAVCKRWHITVALDAEPVQQADEALLWTERAQLLKPSAWPWPGEGAAKPLGITITPWPASVAHARWQAAVLRIGEAAGVNMGGRMGAV